MKHLTFIFRQVSFCLFLYLILFLHNFQLFEPVSCTYTYILGCGVTKKTLIIDPVLEMVERDSTLVSQLGLDLIYGLNTHVHADHVTGTGELKKKFPQMRSIIGSGAGDVQADIAVGNGDIIHFGKDCLEVRTTPGHTEGCITYVNHGNRMAFTGDALLIRGCGRTDFQGGWLSLCSLIIEIPFQEVHILYISLFITKYFHFPMIIYFTQATITLVKPLLLSPKKNNIILDFSKEKKNLSI